MFCDVSIFLVHSRLVLCCYAFVCLNRSCCSRHFAPFQSVIDLHIDDDHQASTVSCSSAAASPQAISEAPPKPSTIEQTVVKIVEDLMDVVTIVTADHETPPKKTKKLRSVAANIERVGEMLAKELEAMEECIMSAEAKASVDDSFEIESFDAVLKMLENMVQDNGKE